MSNAAMIETAMAHPAAGHVVLHEQAVGTTGAFSSRRSDQGIRVVMVVRPVLGGVSAVDAGMSGGATASLDDASVNRGIVDDVLPLPVECSLALKAAATVGVSAQVGPVHHGYNSAIAEAAPRHQSGLARGSDVVRPAPEHYQSAESLSRKVPQLRQGFPFPVRLFSHRNKHHTVPT